MTIAVAQEDQGKAFQQLVYWLLGRSDSDIDHPRQDVEALGRWALIQPHGSASKG